MQEDNKSVTNESLKDQNQGKKNGLAIAGLVCSLCGIITCGFTSIIGLILSIVGLSKSKKMNDEGKGLAIGGIVSGALIIILYVFVFIFMAGSIYSVTNKIINATDNNKSRNDSYYSNYYDDDDEKEEYALGETFEFDDLEITLGESYSFDVVDNQFSDHYNKTVVKLPITIKNVGTTTNGLNMFYYDVYGSKGTEVDVLNTYFSDNVDSAGDLRPEAEYTKYLYFVYDGNGSYTIEFDDYYEEVEVTFDIQK